MPRYAILTHDHPFPHWDFLLEAGDVCLTWRLLAEPRPDGVIAAERLADHRLLYLDYEGPVSGGRGTVARWDRGFYISPQQTSSAWSVTLRGERGLQSACLRRGNGADEWCFEQLTER